MAEMTGVAEQVKEAAFALQRAQQTLRALIDALDKQDQERRSVGSREEKQKQAAKRALTSW